MLCVESQSPRLYGAVMTNDEVEQNDSRLFAFDPIRRIDEWSPAMLADPSHTLRLSKGHATSTADWVRLRSRKDLHGYRELRLPAWGRINIAPEGVSVITSSVLQENTTIFHKDAR